MGAVNDEDEAEINISTGSRVQAEQPAIASFGPSAYLTNPLAALKSVRCARALAE